jgi:hypothetical protein
VSPKKATPCELTWAMKISKSRTRRKAQKNYSALVGRIAAQVEFGQPSSKVTAPLSQPISPVRGSSRSNIRGSNMAILDVNQVGDRMEAGVSPVSFL